MSWIADSVVNSAQDLMVTASSEETIESEAYAGSAAVAIGVGAAVAGAGVEVTNVFDTVTYAWIDQSDVVAFGDLNVSCDFRQSGAEVIGQRSRHFCQPGSSLGRCIPR